MYKAAARWMIRRNISRLNEGDYGPTLAMFADDATLSFPGENTWANQHRPTERGRDAFATHRGRTEIEVFLRRYVQSRMHMVVDDILVNGPPWNARASGARAPLDCGRGWARRLRQSCRPVRQHGLGQDSKSGGLRRHRTSRRLRRRLVALGEWGGCDVGLDEVDRRRRGQEQRAQVGAAEHDAAADLGGADGADALAGGIEHPHSTGT